MAAPEALALRPVVGFDGEQLQPASEALMA
jgi:hypothetical protein